MSEKKKQSSPATAPNIKKVRDFCGTRKVFLIISLSLVAITILATFILKINVAIEFKGGTILNYKYSGEIDENAVRSSVEEIIGTTVKTNAGQNISTGDANITISFTSKNGLTAERQAEITDMLQEKYPKSAIELVDSNDVAPSSGREFFLKCLVAVILSAVVLIIYIAFRFKKIGGLSAGVCAIIALCQDLVLVYGSFIICGFEINSNFMAVILTILGYSINNTIVIYDRIRENRQIMPKAELKELVNLSCTQSLTRSIRTTITTVATMLIVTIVVAVNGYTSLLSFTVPLIFGMALGAYSSLCVAPMLWVWHNERKLSKN